MKKSILILIVTTTIFLQMNAQSEKTIKIASILPCTGAISMYGTSCENGIEMAVNEINAAGGVGGKFITLIERDDQANPALTKDAYTEVTKNQSSNYIIGSLTSGCVLSIVQNAQQDKNILIAPAATKESVTQTGNYIFRTCATDSYQGNKAALFACKQLSKKRAVIFIDEGNDYSVSLADTFRMAFSKNGGSIVSEVTYNSINGSEATVSGKQMLTLKITNLARQKCDIIYIPDYYNKAADLITQIRAAGLDATIIGADGWEGIDSVKKDGLENCYYSLNFSDKNSTSRVQNFVKKYANLYGAGFNLTFAALGYDSVYLLVHAMKNAGGADKPDAVRDALAEREGDYVTGHITYDKNRNPQKPIVFVNAADSTFVCEM